MAPKKSVKTNLNLNAKNPDLKFRQISGAIMREKREKIYFNIFNYIFNLKLNT